MSQRRQYWEKGLRNFKANYYLEYNKHNDAEVENLYCNSEGFAPVILGLCTDSRNPRRTYLDAKNDLMKNADYESQYCYFNLFTVGCIKVNGTLTTSVDELIDAIVDEVNKRVKK